MVHVGDIGTPIEAQIVDNGAPVDISSATVKQFVFSFPDGTKLTRNVVFSSDGTNGKIRYVTIRGFLRTPGTLRYQAHVVTPTGEWWSDIGSLAIDANL